MSPIAHIETPFASKFGVPRQSGIIDIPCRVVFEPPYRVPEAIRGLEGFDYIWLIWHFDKAQKEQWSPTVRPPRLGGNDRVGVFATRSPFRPNALGLSSVRLDHIEHDPLLGPLLYITGADLMNGTPIFDIKPYLPYTDSHPEARSGFAPAPTEKKFNVECPETLLIKIPSDYRQPLLDILACDPRPQYHNDAERVYGMTYTDHNVTFQVKDNTVVVLDILRDS